MALAFETPPQIPDSHLYETDFYAWLIHLSRRLPLPYRNDAGAGFLARPHP